MVGVSRTTLYTDTGLTAGTSYSYAVKALDASKNRSEASNIITATPLNPEIVKVTPSNLAQIGGSINQELRVYFATSGSRAVEKVTFEYSTDDSDWTTITDSITGPVLEDSSTKYFSCLWDIRTIKTGKYKVRYTIYDEVGIGASVITSYDVDRDVPSEPKNLKALLVNDAVELKWECPLEADVIGYKIYRSESETDRFVPIAEAEGRTLSSYMDYSVKDKMTYYYKVTAIDRFKQESEFSNVTAISVNGVDSVKPVVRSIKAKNGNVFSETANLVVEAEDNIMVSRITVQYSVDNGQTWVDAASKLTQGSGSIELKWTTPDVNGEILVRAIAVDMAGNESDGTPVYKFKVDRQGPGKIEDLSAVEYANTVVLRWKHVAEEDFSHFEVERKDSKNGVFKSVGTVKNTLGMQINGLSCDTTYWFRVCAYDIYGNKGTYSDEIVVKTLLDTSAPVIYYRGSAPGYYNEKVILSADIKDNTGVEKIVFQISTDNEVWSDITTIEPKDAPENTTVNYEMDVSKMVEGTYYVRGIATDILGNTTSEPFFIEYRIDHTIPAQPENFAATPSYSKIKLEWDKGEENDLACYKLYRSTEKDGKYDVVHGTVMTLGYIDSNVKANTKYYYKVVSVDFAGNESPASGPVSCVLLGSDDDTEKPIIHAISPNKETMLPPNPSIGVSVEDNYIVKTVTLKYQIQEDSTDEWKLIGSKEVNKYGDFVSFTWDTTGLSDGNYIVKAVAVDEAGNKSDDFTANYKLNIEPPAAPTLTAVPGDFKVELSWQCGEEEDIGGFLIYRSTVPDSISDYICINGTRERSYTDEYVEAGKTYYYMIKAVDIRGNFSWSSQVKAIPTGVDTVSPVAEAGEDQKAVIGMEIEFDGSSSYDNNCIERYEWDFGDGNTANTVRAIHTYEKIGTYDVKLTVYDPAGNVGSTAIKVYILPDDEASTLEVEIVDELSGAPVSDARVLVQHIDGKVKEYVTDSQGLVKMVGTEGTYKIFAYKQGHSSSEGEVTLLRGSSVKKVICLKDTPVVIGELKVKRMTFEEIVNAGVDVNDPENQWVYECNIVLGFRPVTLTVNGGGKILSGPGGYHGPGGDYWRLGGGYGYGDYYVCPQVVTTPNHPEVPPTIYYLVIPAKVGWLKEFFEVSLIMQNTAEKGSAFTITNATAELQAPEGLTFIPSNYSRSTKVDMESIEPGETKEAKWVLRGDQKGEYILKAEFEGILQPFGELINSVYMTQEPVKVWGDDALVMHVKAEDYAFINELYLAKVELENVSDAELYNVSFEVKEGEGYVFPPEFSTSETYDVIKPGEKKVFEIWVLPNFTGVLDLSHSFIVKTGGNATIKTTLTSIPAPKARFEVNAETIFDEVTEDNYYTYKIVANVSNLRDIAGNVKAELEWIKTEGVKDIEISEAEVQELGDMIAGAERCLVWSVKFKAVSKTANIQYAIKVSGNNARSKKVEGSINAGDADFRIWLYNNEKEDPDYEDNIRYFTIGVRIYNDGGIAKNAKAELKIFSEYGENIVKVLTPKVQDLGSFSKWEYTEWELEVEKNVKTLRYQVAISADNAESVTAEGDLFIEEQEPKPLDLERFYYNPNQYYKDLALRAAEYAMLAYDDYAWSEKNGTYYTKKPDERDLIPKLLDDKLIEHNFIDVKICNYADSLENNVSFVIANKYVDYFGSKRNLTAVIIRGTDEVEWFGNMDVTGREYQDDLTNHWSFESGKDSVLKELRIYLKKHEIEDPLLLITGHSRGAAAANLLAEHIIRLKDYDSQFNGIDDSIFNDSDVSLFNDSEVFAYTFATPNTTKSPNKNLSIFNFRIMDDFVPQVPLEAWEYGQHGVTFSTIAQKLYKNDVLFSIQVDRYVNASGGKGKANYDYNKTQFILKYVGAVWKNVELYYKKSVYIENLFYPNQTIYDMTLYAFFRNVVARAAIKDLKGSVDIVFKLLDNRVFAPIAEFFITGNTIVEYVNDAHQMFSYYAALKNDGFVLDEPEGVNLQSFAFHDDSIVIKSAPKYESKEVEKLKNFAQQGDNLKRLGWDLEDASTWNGVKWSNNDQSRVIDIILSYKGLTGKLDLSEFSELQNLDISGNMITSIDLSKCTSLIDVDCSHNELTELILTDSSMLSILNCSWNGIQTLDISKCSNIQKLYCNNNKLSSLDLSSNSRLTELYCGYNDLETINLSSNTLLDTVSCEYNKFDIQEDSFMYKAMKSIEEKKNSWVVFEPQKMPEHPVFNSEDISKILDFVKQEDNSSKLEWDLSQPENWYGIEWYKAKNEYRTRRIEIDNLNLTGKLNFSNMPYLEYLSIRNNQIDEVNISGCKSLKFLDVHNSSLKRLDISNCPNITRLECEKNYLQINNSELLNDISRINQKEDSIVNYSLQMILAKKDVFNQNEYRILVQFANVSQNISILNWDVNKPGEWPEISWEMYDGEYRVTKISFKYMDLTGKLDVSSFDKLTDLECRLTKITSILLPNSLIEIKPFMFYDCSELTEVVIPNGVICIGEYAFYNCKKLSNIIMPDTILSIGRNAFRICKDLNTIVIPSNVSAVSDGAFYDCKNLSKAIFLGNAPDSFGYNVFSGTKSDFMIIYKKGASGFDKLFNKYNCEAVDKLPNEIETPIPGEPTPTPTPTPTPSEGGNTHPGNGGNTGETAEQPAGSNGGNGINVQPVVEEPAKPKEEPVENEGPIEKEDPAKPSETPVVEPKPVDVPAVKEDVKYKVYIRGYQDNSFRPENNLTRAEMAVILANLDGVTKDDFTSFGFTDVKKEHWAAWAISYVTNKGYFKGYNDNTFRPDKYITRAELSVVICKYLNLEVNVKSTNTFPDISRHWALDYINKLVSSGYIKGYPDGSFKPDNNIKRSECVTLINRALGIKPLKDLQKRFIDVDTKHWAFGDIMAASGAN